MKFLKEQIEAALTEELNLIEAGGALCALNVNGVESVYSVGDISESDHGSSFYIYSISKTVTATAVMLLCERGLIDLDEDLSSWRSDYLLPEGTTVRRLLNHTGGLSDYFSSKEYQSAVHSCPFKPWSYEKLMGIGLANTPLFEPGDGWMYSNPAYAILRELIEERSGAEYYEFIQLNVLVPLSLQDTHPFVSLDHGIDLLHGVDPAMEQDFRQVYHPGWIATGCFISTLSDVSKFYQALFSGALLTAESIEQMKQTVPVPFAGLSPREPRYGLGLMSFDSDPHGENYGHGGGGPGYSNFVKHLPNVSGKQVTLVLVVNASLAQTPFNMAHRALDCCLEALNELI